MKDMKVVKLQPKFELLDLALTSHEGHHNALAKTLWRFYTPLNTQGWGLEFCDKHDSQDRPFYR